MQWLAVSLKLPRLLVPLAASAPGEEFTVIAGARRPPGTLPSETLLRAPEMAADAEAVRLVARPGSSAADGGPVHMSCSRSGCHAMVVRRP